MLRYAQRVHFTFLTENPSNCQCLAEFQPAPQALCAIVVSLQLPARAQRNDGVGDNAGDNRYDYKHNELTASPPRSKLSNHFLSS